MVLERKFPGKSLPKIIPLEKAPGTGADPEILKKGGGGGGCYK